MRKRSVALLASTALSLSVGISAFATDGGDFYIDDYYSMTRGDSDFMYWSGDTEGAGSDLEYVRVYSYFYANGSLVKTSSDNDSSHASVEYERDGTFTSAQTKSSHYAYNQVGDKETRTSSDSWN